jgi:NAD(P)H-nitrite reductase large subunit
VITYSDVQGGYAGIGNIDADPLFVLAPHDLSLRSASPCIDTGTNTNLPQYGNVTEDIIGTPRPQRMAYDMGAYEYAGSSWSPVSLQPLARTQLQAALALWNGVACRIPCDPSDEVTALVWDIQKHMENAAQLTNPVYASGQLAQAAALMEALAALLG